MTLDIKRILVPLDFSANSTRALDYAYGLALKFGAALHLVHVCEGRGMLTPAMDSYAIGDTDWSQRLAAEADRQLVETAMGLAAVKATTEVLFGPAALAIVDAAEANQVDLIVMGTHGHGALMHVVLGNVAERVVRSSTCPVLTVREPRQRRSRTVTRSRLTAAMASVLVAGVMLAPSAASAQTPEAQPVQMKQTTPGAEVFRTYCATCHGPSARGDGPLANSMLRKPPNLTEIAKRNGGQFPSEVVFRTIDGRQPVRGHGGPDMPVWGDAFTRSREAGDADRVKAVIQSLVAYLESVQLKPAHQQ